jgi:hypothetical protein
MEVSHERWLGVDVVRGDNQPLENRLVHEASGLRIAGEVGGVAIRPDQAQHLIVRHEHIVGFVRCRLKCLKFDRAASVSWMPPLR